MSESVGGAASKDERWSVWTGQWESASASALGPDERSGESPLATQVAQISDEVSGLDGFRRTSLTATPSCGLLRVVRVFHSTHVVMG